MRPLAALLALLTLAVAACGGDDGGASPTSSASASPTGTPAASPAVSAGATAPPVEAYQVIFVRAAGSALPDVGSLWIGHIDGSNTHRLTAEGELASFAGVAPNPDTLGRAAYFVVLDGDTARTLWAVDLATGQRSQVFHYQSARPEQGDAAVSPDGNFIAYADVEGMQLFSRSAGRKFLLANGPAPCDAGSCLGNSYPQWSPDGTLLMVRRTFWEGGTNIVFDPFLESSTQPPRVPSAQPFEARWAPATNDACGWGRYAENSGLYLAQPASFGFVNVIPEYEKYPPDLPLVDRNVSGCAFLDPEHIAFTVDVLRYDSDPDPGPPPERSVELRVFETASGDSTLVSEYKGGVQIMAGNVFAFPGTGTVLMQLLIDEEGAGGWGYSQPKLVDVATGQELAALEAGDRLVAVVAP